MTEDAAEPEGEPVGEPFGPYRLIEILGRGGMGEVWRAYDTRRGRTVALKRLADGWTGVAAFETRFRREARATAHLNSEHVIVIHDFGEIDGRLFIDMRLITGGDLAQVLAGRGDGLGVDRAVDLCAQIADALDAAHREHLVHRDVKPSNVLLAPDGRRERAYLVDFGIAKIADEATGAGLTATGSTLGTPAYMAPELVSGTGAAAPASDVYALACLAFEMLTGRRVFLGTTAAALLSAHLHESPPTLSSVRGELAPFDAVLARALEKDPERRPESAGALAAELVDVADALRADALRADALRAERPATTVVEPSPATRRPAPWWRRRVVPLAVAAVVVVVGAVTVGVLAGRGPGAPPPAVVAPAGPPPVPRTPPGPPQQLAVPLSNPNPVAVAPDGRHVYVGDTDHDTVTVVDATTNLPTATVPAGPGPVRIVVSPDGRRAYVVDNGHDPPTPGSTVTVLDTTTNTVVGTVGVGPDPVGAAVSPDGRRLYVANAGVGDTPANTVSVIDTATDRVVATVTVGAGPNRLGISPDGRRVYVPDYGPVDDLSSTVSVIDTASDTVPLTLPAGDLGPVVAAPASDDRHVYIVCAGALPTRGSVQVLDTVTNTLAPLAPGAVNNPFEAALTPDGRTLVVTNYGQDTAPDSTVVLIDTATGRWRTVTLGARPFGVAVSPDGTVAWVTTVGGGGLWRVPLG